MFRPRLLVLASGVVVLGGGLSLPTGIESVFVLRQIRVSTTDQLDPYLDADCAGPALPDFANFALL